MIESLSLMKKYASNSDMGIPPVLKCSYFNGVVNFQFDLEMKYEDALTGLLKQFIFCFINLLHGFLQKTQMKQNL